MEQQLDAFTQKKYELMIDMATKKLQQEIVTLKEAFNALNGELNSLRSQVSRLQFQPQTVHHAEEQREIQHQQVEQKKEIKIVDCRPEEDRKQEFQSGAAKNAEPVRPRYGDYKPEDVSIGKFFYFGRK